MSMHRKPCTPIEAEGLRKHGLAIGTPSQLSDCFRHGMRWATEQQALMLPPLDDTMRSILGRPNFTCTGIAAGLRQNGHDIERKSEHEQAAVIYWMLSLYLLHGDAWQAAALALLGTEPIPTQQPKEA